MCDLNHGHKYKKKLFSQIYEIVFFYRCDARHPPIGVGTRWARHKSRIWPKSTTLFFAGHDIRKSEKENWILCHSWQWKGQRMEWGLFDKTLTPCLNSILRFNLTSSNFSKITSQIKISYKDHRKFTKRSSRLIVTLLEEWFSTLTLSKNSDLASGASSILLRCWECYSRPVF